MISGVIVAGVVVKAESDDKNLFFERKREIRKYTLVGRYWCRECREICHRAQHLRPQLLTTSHHFAPNHTQHPITTPSIAQLSPAAAPNGGRNNHHRPP